MTRRRYAQLTLTQVVLFGLLVPEPEALMDPELRRIDKLLDDEALVDEVLATLARRYERSTRRGRPGTPAEVVLRMLFLKHLRNWSFERLEWEVTGNIVYRRFCRIDAQKVPDAKTLVRLGQLLDGARLRALFDRVVAMTVEKGTTRGRKMRVDTTVVDAPIRYPTDSRLCEDAVRVLRRNLVRLVAAGVRLPFHLRNVQRAVSRRAREIGQALRLRGERAMEAIKKPYRGLLRVTSRLVRQAERAIAEAPQKMRRLDDKSRRVARRALEKLIELAPRARQIVRQTRARVLRGVANSTGKILSVFEPWAKILRRGKVHKPTEFGLLVKVQEAEGGVVTDIGVAPASADAPLLVPSVKRHIEVFGRPPRLVAGDRAFHSSEGERAVGALGVKQVAIPKPGHRSAQRIEHERQRWFRRGRAWRVGNEARISRLKYRFGMVRSRYRGEAGLHRTIFWAAIVNNAAAMAR
jgi:IS5 family transposase